MDGRVTTVVDAHVHAWDPGRLAYPWLAAHPRLVRRIVPADLRPGVPLAGRVLVEADCRPPPSLPTRRMPRPPGCSTSRARTRARSGWWPRSGSSAARPSGPS